MVEMNLTVRIVQTGWLLFYSALGAGVASIYAVRFPDCNMIFFAVAGASLGLLAGYAVRMLLSVAGKAREGPKLEYAEWRSRQVPRKVYSLIGCIHGAVIGYAVSDFGGSMSGMMTGIVVGAVSGDIRLIASLRWPNRTYLQALIGAVAEVGLICLIYTSASVWSDDSAVWVAAVTVPILALRLYTT
jgi:hypothetical protein